jgi:small-conductance mechanosensitive channel
VSRRSSRLLVPFVLTAVLGAIYAFLHFNPSWIAHFVMKPQRIENVILFVATLPAILLFVRALDLLAFDVFVPRRSVRAPMLLREIVSIALFLILFAWAMWVIFDYRVTAFLATGTVVAAVLGLALQETLGNLFAGIALHLEDSFEVGDVVRSGEFYGVVEAVRWRGTRLRTFNNSVVIVPNSMLARERVEVFPRQNLNGRVIQVSVDYNVPPADVIAVLTQAASHVPGVAQETPAFARVAAFGDSAVLYDIKYFVKDYSQRDVIDAEIRKAVWYALRRHGFSIPFPIRSMHRYEPPPARPQPSRDEIIDRLDDVGFLAPLPAEALQSIAAAARVHVFSSGETIIRQGAAGDSMFIVHHGTVAVLADGSEVARLDARDFFGEMALLTGEKRAADVVALTEAVIIEITKSALQPVLRDHPELAAAISTEVTERRGTLATARAASAESQQSVLSRIRSYFGL